MRFIGLVPWGVGGPRKSSRPPVHSGSTVGPACHTLPSPDVPIPSISVKRWCKKMKKAGWHLPSQPLGRVCWSAGADSALRRWPGTTRRRLPFATSPHPRAAGAAEGGRWSPRHGGLAGLSARRDPSLRLHFRSFGSSCSKTHRTGPMRCVLLFVN